MHRMFVPQPTADVTVFQRHTTLKVHKINESTREWPCHPCRTPLRVAVWAVTYIRAEREPPPVPLGEVMRVISLIESRVSSVYPGRTRCISISRDFQGPITPDDSVTPFLDSPPPMPHQIFEIDELLRLVVDELVEISPRSAVSFALTCRFLEEPTLSSLWKEQTSLIELMKVLPQHICIEDKYHLISIVSGRDFLPGHVLYQFP